ncbi:hypothetical protein SO802_034584 [Lithocarpus litseifolius]|uniref:Uncharacterized protein n=1 Tax=Lithocarpus litseifolius TaxID=425828 RepID=A0AAW2BGC8_9ROSI
MGGFVYTDDYQQTPAVKNRLKRRDLTRLADIWALYGEYKIPLTLNDEGQLIGLDGGAFVRWLRTFYENGLLCLLMLVGWPSVPEKFKQDCWIEIEKRYLIDPDIVVLPDQMEWAMHQLEVLRRNRKTKLKKDHYKRGMTKEQVLANKLSTVDKVQWTEMVNYWFLDKTMLLCLLYEILFIMYAKTNEILVERTDVYLKVYSRKDGAANRMEELLTQEGMRLQGELGNGILWSKDDAYALVFGLERPGRVRGVGFGITPSGRSATNLSQFTSTPSSLSRTSQRISELETSLREKLAHVQEQLS